VDSFLVGQIMDTLEEFGIREHFLKDKADTLEKLLLEAKKINFSLEPIENGSSTAKIILDIYTEKEGVHSFIVISPDEFEDYLPLGVEMSEVWFDRLVKLLGYLVASISKQDQDIKR